MIAEAARTALKSVLGGGIDFDVPMSRYTSLRIGGPADALATPGSRDALLGLLRTCAEHDLPHTPLGAGFNTLVSDAGLEGVAISLKKLRAIEQKGNTVRAEAGVSHGSITRFCCEQGLSGLEFGAGIPGTVGGWVTMNAGIGSREIVDVVLELECASPTGEKLESYAAESLRFEYRALRGLAPGSVVVSALFELRPSSPEAVKSEMKRLLAQRADTQPLDVPSCGSVFKNPEGDYAGRLIEAAGLKGHRVGGAQISTVHANFIANLGDATAADVMELIRTAREEVERSSGIRLEAEVRLVGRNA